MNQNNNINDKKETEYLLDIDSKKEEYPNLNNMIPQPPDSLAPWEIEGIKKAKRLAHIIVKKILDDIPIPVEDFSLIQQILSIIFNNEDLEIIKNVSRCCNHNHSEVLVSKLLQNSEFTRNIEEFLRNKNLKKMVKIFVEEIINEDFEKDLNEHRHISNGRSKLPFKVFWKNMRAKLSKNVGVEYDKNFVNLQAKLNSFDIYQLQNLKLNAQKTKFINDSFEYNRGMFEGACISLIAIKIFTYFIILPAYLGDSFLNSNNSFLITTEVGIYSSIIAYLLYLWIYTDFDSSNDIKQLIEAINNAMKNYIDPVNLSPDEENSVTITEIV